MKYKKVMNRRTLLRGAGTVAIGMPFLDAMRTTSVFARAPEPPARAFNIFFGLGMPRQVQGDGLAGPMEPLGELMDKLALIRGVSQLQCDGAGNAHYDGAAGAFTATRPEGEAVAGGPSLDQLLLRHAYPEGVPSGMIPSLLMGTYFRRSRPGRFIHSWAGSGSPTDLPIEDPAALFTRIFGTAPSMMGGTEAEQRAARLHESVLDSVVEQYRHYQSDASNLGVGARARLKDHFDRIREYETRVFGDPPESTCTEPDDPGGSVIPHGAAADPDGQGIDITVEALVGEWRKMADLFTIGVQCDRLRFGAVTFQAAGERIRLSGRYEYEGRTIRDFNDMNDLNGVANDGGCSHEFWHQIGGSGEPGVRAHVHLMMREITYFMKQLDLPEHADENGLSILENSMTTISTESGDGRHSSPQNELEDVFHAITGANERFQTGGIIDVDGASGLDLYNTMLGAHGVSAKLGDEGRPVETISSILR